MGMVHAYFCIHFLIRPAWCFLFIRFRALFKKEWNDRAYHRETTAGRGQAGSITSSHHTSFDHSMHTNAFWDGIGAPGENRVMMILGAAGVDGR